MPNTDSKPTSDKEQTQASQIYPHTPTYLQQIEDDSINLYELWITLWNKKWLVIAVTAILALGSVVYALLQPFVYKAEALLLPPKGNDIQSLSVRGVHEISSNIVFDTFKNNLSSRSLQKKFIEVQDLMDFLAPNRTPETRDIEILESFAAMINIENKGGLSVSMMSDDPNFAAKLVNDYIDFFDNETIRELSNVLRNLIAGRVRDIEYTIGSKKQMEIVRREDEIKDIENLILSKREREKKRREDEIKKIEYTISSKRQMAKTGREDQILHYEEAAAIASKLGVEDRVDTTNEVKNNQLNITTIGIPLYNRGFRALRAEIELLKNRKSDDPFINGLRDLQEELAHLQSRKSDDPYIFGLRDLQVQLEQLLSAKSDFTLFPGLRSLQEELALLRSIKIEEEGQHSVTIDQPAYPPKYRIKPNRRRITLVGTSVGLLFGIFLAFVVSFMQKQKEIHST